MRPVRSGRGRGGAAVNEAKWGEKVTSTQNRRSRAENLEGGAPENPMAPKKRGRPKASTVKLWS